MSGRRILVAGGAGFLGSHLTDLLLSRGDTVVCVDNFATGARANIDHLLGRADFELIEADVCEPFVVGGALDAVMDLASPASPKDFETMPLEILDVGSRGVRTLLELASAKDAVFFLASTSEVYGDPLVHPQPESYWGNVNPNGLRSCYDEAKRFAEATTMAFHRARGVDVRIVRIFNTYGPRMRPDDGRVVVNLLTAALTGQPLTVYGDGSQTRSFTFVEDEVRGFVALLDSDITTPVNIGNPNEFTIMELAHLVLEVTGSSSPIETRPLPADDPMQRKPDITIARTRLGWEPTVALRDGLVVMRDWLSSLRGYAS
ncbi:MAG: UDP-glucuronic acid decarboxylase family protein [Acidimicrobiia bacterium]